MKTLARACVVVLLASVIVPGLVVVQDVEARNAATIRYDFVPEPPGLPGGFVAPPNARLRFLAIQAIDGFQVDAALFEQRPANEANTTLVISVHGSGGTYTGSPMRFLSPGLAGAGYAVLGINTRQAGPHNPPLGNLADNFLEIRRDIEAAVYTARDLGYQKIVLHGQSLGNIQVQYYAANNWDHDLKAVLLTGVFANLPWKSRHILIQNEANYHQLFSEAKAALAAGTEANDLATQMRWLGGVVLPVTGMHFLTYRWDKSSVADGTFWINRIPRPILMIRGKNDTTVLDFEPNMLLAAATAEGTLVPNIQYVPLPNASHGLDGNESGAIAAVVAWLQSLGL